MIKAKKLSQSGFGVASPVFWEAVHTEEISREEAQEAQAKASYHPCGYGFYDFKCVQQIDGTWKATWKCYASCD